MTKIALFAMNSVPILKKKKKGQRPLNKQTKSIFAISVRKYLNLHIPLFTLVVTSLSSFTCGKKVRLSYFLYKKKDNNICIQICSVHE